MDTCISNCSMSLIMCRNNSPPKTDALTGWGEHYSRSFIEKHITPVKPKFTLTEVDIKSLERLLAL